MLNDACLLAKIGADTAENELSLLKFTYSHTADGASKLAGEDTERYSRDDPLSVEAVTGLLVENVRRETRPESSPKFCEKIINARQHRRSVVKGSVASVFNAVRAGSWPHESRGGSLPAGFLLRDYHA